jgi:hypothetical protein
MTHPGHALDRALGGVLGRVERAIDDVQGEIVLPQEAAGQDIVLRLDLGGDAVIFVNGVVQGGRRRWDGGRRGCGTCRSC